jgi:hypothetical protein
MQVQSVSYRHLGKALFEPPLSFANSHPSADGNVDPGWIGTTTGVIVGKRADVGRVIASGRTRFRGGICARAAAALPVATAGLTGVIATSGHATAAGGRLRPTVRCNGFMGGDQTDAHCFPGFLRIFHR